MEFLFYMVACIGLILVSVPLISISNSLQKLASTVEEDDSKPVLARVRTK
tara:strand:- start:2117 stop:2266 length:150 start_codon:yes stop_codon:yes gene_type:complete